MGHDLRRIEARLDLLGDQEGVEVGDCHGAEAECAQRQHEKQCALEADAARLRQRSPASLDPALKFQSGLHPDEQNRQALDWMAPQVGQQAEQNSVAGHEHECRVDDERAESKRDAARTRPRQATQVAKRGDQHHRCAEK